MKLDNALEVVGSSNLLSLPEFDDVFGIKEEMQKVWDTVQMFRTEVEMEMSVLDDLSHPTPDAKYWQCIREQNVMLSELINASFEYKKILITIKKIEKNMAAEFDELTREFMMVEIEQKKFQALGIERMSKDRVRELKQWEVIKAKLIPKMKYGTEDVNRHQWESYPMKFQNNAAFITEKSSPAEAKTLMGLHITAQNRVKEKMELEKLNA